MERVVEDVTDGRGSFKSETGVEDGKEWETYHMGGTWEM